ncbi:hypothetical protein PAMA_011335 [Pampus argenteus]
MIPENVPETAGRDPGETCAADIDRNVHLRLTGLAGSEGSLRRAVRASSCGLCGDRKYVFPQQKTLGKQGQKRGCPGAEQPVFTVTPKKFIVWIDRYPKVTLCDVAQKCDATSHNSGIVLSGVLKTKVVRCFKQDMRAGFQRRPGCLGHIKHGSEESAPAKNSGLCPRVQTERSICQPQSLTENPKHLKEHTDAETPSGHTTCHFLKDWASEASATCSSSFPLGTCTDKGECRTAMWDKDVEEVCGPGYDFMGDKRVKLGDGTENSSLPFTSDLENISSNDPAKTRDKEKTCSGMSADSQSCLELAVGSCRAFSSAVKDNCVHKNPGKTDAALISSELFCQRTDLDTDDHESLTCQRVRVYFRKTHFSCARTYVSWPFSNSGHTLAAHAGTTACPAEPIDPSARGNRHSSINQNRSGSTYNQASVALPNAATDSSPNRVSPRNDERGENGREEDGEKVGGHDDASLNSSTGGNMEFVPLFREKSLTSPLSDIVTVSNPGSQRDPGTETVSVPSASPANGPQTDSSMSTPSPAALGLKEQESDGAFFTSRNSPKPEPYYNASPCNHDVVGKERSLHVVPAEQGVYTKSNMVLLPPLLSPLNSPQWHSRTNFLPQRPCSLDEEQEEEEMRRDTNRQTMLNGHHMPQIVNGDRESCKNDLEHCVEFKGKSPDFKTLTDDTLREFQSSLSSDEDVDDGNEEESQDETDGEDDEVQGSKSVLSDPKIKENMTSGVLRQTCSSPSGDDDDNDDDDDDDGGVFNGERQPLSIKEERSSSFEIAGSERHKTKAEAAGDTQSCIFDEFTAYEQDILLVDVIQDDPELFDNLPQKSVLKLGPTRISESPKTRPTGVVKTPVTHRASVYSEQRLTPVNIDSLCDSSEITEESVSRPWRPQCSSRKPFKMQSNTLPVTDKQTKTVGQSDANNNHVNGDPERNQTIQTVNSTPNHVPLPMSYCRQYFTESLSCGFKMCRFQHVPVEGDEKFCVDTVTRFSKNPVCLQKAGAVFTGYYQSNPPGAYFSMPVLLSLLWALLKAGMVPDVFSVLSVSLTHKIVPDHEFLLALFNYVREKGLMVCVPELIQLTFKMASAGLVLNLDCFDYVKNTPEFKQTVYSNSPVSVSDNHKLSVFPTAPFPEYLNLAQSLVEIELCTKQENWRRMGEVFKSICQPCQHPNQVERISGSIAVALLCESKDKLSLPFAAFSETDNNWFLTSSPWPCELADLESRSRVLMRLAEKTSHRDTLEVLNMIDISRYIPLFNSHLQVCVDRQILPVASDTVDFMLFKNLAVDHTMLQLLLHKLGKQNLWLRAREVFRHSLSVGYYAGVSAPPGFMALIVPCRLGEIELALAFEMFITVNATVIVHLTEATTSCLSITLKRTQSCESEYLSAGSRLLSAACIPQPKLIVHYTAVNSSREQVFTLDISSARHWLRRNHLWANEGHYEIIALMNNLRSLGPRLSLRIPTVRWLRLTPPERTPMVD